MNSRCPICSGASLFHLTEESGRPLLICRACRHIFWESFPTPAEVEAYYEASYSAKHNQDAIQEANRAYYREHAYILLALTKRGPEETSVLDFGCSFPTFLEEAKAVGFKRTVGVEPATQIDSDVVEIIRPNDVANLEDDSFDIVRFCHVLEHLPDPVGTLRSVATKIRPGGLIYITQPSFPVLKCKKGGKPPHMAVYPEHLHFFSPISLAVLAEANGLRIRHLFTHQQEAEVLARHQGFIDIPFAWLKMRRLKGAVDEPRGTCAYPYYAGQNSSLHAFKQGASS